MAFTERRSDDPERTWNWPGPERRKRRGGKIDAAAEEAYWRANFMREPYFERGYVYADYHPGYRTGWEGRARYPGCTFDEVERDLEFDYARLRGKSRLEWEKNRHAARAAWERFDPD